MFSACISAFLLAFLYFWHFDILYWTNEKQKRTIFQQIIYSRMYCTSVYRTHIAGDLRAYYPIFVFLSHQTSARVREEKT